MAMPARRSRQSRRAVRLDFAAIEIAGALLPPEIVTRAAAFDLPDQSDEGYGFSRPQTPRRDRPVLPDALGSLEAVRCGPGRQCSRPLSVRPRSAPGLLRFCKHRRNRGRSCCPSGGSRSGTPLTMAGCPSSSRHLPRLRVGRPALMRRVLSSETKPAADRPASSCRNISMRTKTLFGASRWMAARSGSCATNVSLTRPRLDRSGSRENPHRGALRRLLRAMAVDPRQPVRRHGCIPVRLPARALARARAHRWLRAKDKLRIGVEAALRELGAGFLENPANGDLRDALRDRQADPAGLLRGASASRLPVDLPVRCRRPRPPAHPERAGHRAKGLPARLFGKPPARAVHQEHLARSGITIPGTACGPCSTPSPRASRVSACPRSAGSSPPLTSLILPGLASPTAACSRPSGISHGSGPTDNP